MKFLTLFTLPLVTFVYGYMNPYAANAYANERQMQSNYEQMAINKIKHDQDMNLWRGQQQQQTMLNQEQQMNNMYNQPYNIYGGNMYNQYPGMWG